jgi:endonuclease YncB( thermonuclease family)
MKKLLLILSLFCIVSCEYKAKIISVHDGDSFTLDNGRKIRLYEADSPELGQAFGREALWFADSVLHLKEVTVKEHGKSYGRTVAEIDIDGQNFADLLVSNGFAHVDYRYCRNAKLMSEYEQAKYHKIGLFSKEYILPSEYRFHHKKL